MKVIDTERLPIKIWISPKGWKDGNYDTEAGFVDAIQQAKNLANHPLTVKHVGLMPDFHVGYGMPIGGVIATQGGVIPNAVGVDIGCGMIAVKTHLNHFSQPISKPVLQDLRLSIHKKVPVGMAKHNERQYHPYLDVGNLEEKGVLLDPVISEQYLRADEQIGSLGSGNHFIEIQVDEEGFIWIMIHSGSRNLGKTVCDYYHGKAKKYMEMFHVGLADNDLAFLPQGMPEFNQYMKAMQFCMGYAEASREQMYQKVKEAFKEQGLEFEEKIKFDTHHNFAAMENHFGKNVIVHRKGAVKASGLLTIPGSMGTSSYICEGLNPTESFNTCSHGAGRMMGRKQANKAITHEQAVEMMKDVVFGIKQGDYDEMPIAYKDINEVIEWQKDLVKPVYKLTPLAVCKG